MSSTDSRIARLEQIIGYTFTSKLLCAESLQMASTEEYLSINGSLHFVKKNKNLESVGDTVIATVLCKKWYKFRDDQGTHVFLQVYLDITC